MAENTIKGKSSKKTAASIFEKYGFWDRKHKIRWKNAGLGAGGSNAGYTDLRVFVNTLSRTNNPAGLYLGEYNKQEAKRVVLDYLNNYEKRHKTEDPEETEKARKIKSELLIILGE